MSTVGSPSLVSSYPSVARLIFALAGMGRVSTVGTVGRFGVGAGLQLFVRRLHDFPHMVARDLARQLKVVHHSSFQVGQNHESHFKHL